MWRNRLPYVALAAGLLLACDRAPTQVQTPIASPKAALIENGWSPIESEYVTCNGDVLWMVGTVHITSTEVYNGAGMYQARYQLNIRATATGPGGSIYNVWNNSVQLSNDPPTPGMEVTWNMKVKLTGKGPAVNENFYWLFHATLNASGELTSYFSKTTASC